MSLSEEQERELLHNMADQVAILAGENADRNDLAHWFRSRLGNMEDDAKGTEAAALGVKLGQLVYEYSNPRLITAGQDRELVEAMLATIRETAQQIRGENPPPSPPPSLILLDAIMSALDEKAKPTTAGALGRELGHVIIDAVRWTEFT